jgi:hypothetical protein
MLRKTNTPHDYRWLLADTKCLKQTGDQPSLSSSPCYWLSYTLSSIAAFLKDPLHMFLRTLHRSTETGEHPSECRIQIPC